MHNMRSIVSGLLIPSFQFRQYTLKEKIDLWRGKASSGISCLWDEMITTDLTKQVTRFDLPVYFISGVYDYTVNYQLSKAYFEKIQAPLKGFYTFEQSAHSPMFEETEKMLRILQEDVVTGTNSLADAK
jgi:pimeloyl-ACP methyl ester carboxylesterase